MLFSPSRCLAALAAITAPLAGAGCSSITYGTGIPVAQQTVQDISDMMSPGGEQREEIVYKPRGGKVVVPPNSNLTAPPNEYRTPQQKKLVAAATPPPADDKQKPGFKWPWQWGQPDPAK